MNARGQDPAGDAHLTPAIEADAARSRPRTRITATPAGLSTLVERSRSLRHRLPGLRGVLVVTAAGVAVSTSLCYLIYLAVNPSSLHSALAMALPVLLSAVTAFPFMWLLLRLVDALDAELESRMRSEAQFRHHARHDHLTGLLNRRRLLELLAEGLSHRSVDAVVWVDVDHFKQINDEYGHARGDRVLQRVSKALQEVADGHGEIGRMGGEEFLIVIREPGVDLVGLAKALDRSVDTLTDPACAVSIGATRVRNDDDIDTLLVRADDYLYEAKRGGRRLAVIDGVRVADPRPD